MTAAAAGKKMAMAIVMAQRGFASHACATFDFGCFVMCVSKQVFGDDARVHRCIAQAMNFVA